MKPHQSLPTLLACAGMIAILSFQIAQFHRSSQLTKRLDAIEQGHNALQETYLEGSQGSKAKLAASLGYRAIAPAQVATRAENSAVGRDGNATPPRKPEQITSDMQRIIAAEPKNAAWAGNVQLNIRDVVETLSRENLPIPSPSTVDCRSRHCLISFDLAPDNDSDAWTQQFITEIAGDLPGATMVQSISPDGQGTKLHIFAGAR